MALLLDLPAAPRRELAARWGTEEDAASLYRTMTDPVKLAALSAASRRVLVALATEPLSPEELLARLPISADALTGHLQTLGGLGLVLRPPEAGGRVPRLALGIEPGERCYVPTDVAAALEPANT